MIVTEVNNIELYDDCNFKNKNKITDIEIRQAWYSLKTLRSVEANIIRRTWKMKLYEDLFGVKSAEAQDSLCTCNKVNNIEL